MDLAWTAEQVALRHEFRRYLAGLLTEAERAELAQAEGGPLFRDVIRRLGRDGWLAPGWPVEYGGRGLDTLAQKIVMEELWWSRAPFPFVTVNTVGPTLIRVGTDAQRREFLPRIARGEALFAIGYTEPQAGSDLAALTTVAERVAGGYRVRGQKIYTSGAEGADYIWLAARTEPGSIRHRGISVLIVDARAPGLTITPIRTVAGVRTNATYYDEVFVPEDRVVGEPGSGWRLITEQLNHERVGLAALAFAGNACFDRVLEWARATRDGDGAALIDRPQVRLQLAECYARLATLDDMNNRMACEIRDGRVRQEFAAACKVAGAATVIEVLDQLMQIVGPQSVVAAGAPGALLAGRLEEELRRFLPLTFGGGTAEVLRDMIAQVGLRLPRHVQ
ncbi:MAG: acyl-CoA dehydrogenase [Gammaproteobacteria bacterium]|nr:MAG: acyl-CoA dehydrogenase [Gammaproteobacteria bacterium]